MILHTLPSSSFSHNSLPTCPDPLPPSLPFNPCSPPSLCHLCSAHFPVSLQFSHSGFIAFFSLPRSPRHLSLSLFTSVPLSLFHSLTQRAAFRRNPILSLFLNLLFHFTPILSHCSAHTIPAPPSFQPLFSVSTNTHTFTGQRTHGHAHKHLHNCEKANEKRGRYGKQNLN